jgi:exopolyphosphatase/guanosine-5'-triphosphate,3'-diphosphate pyrophosphatase
MPAMESEAQPTAGKNVGAPAVLAVIDCGSTAIRATIAEERGNDWRVLDEFERRIDLLPALTAGRLDHRAMNMVVNGFRLLLQNIRPYQPTQVRAVASAALRDNANADVLLERLQREIDLDLWLISGAEFARLYFLALGRVLKRSKRSLPGQSLLMDLGSGKSSLALMSGTRLQATVEDHIGTYRIIDQFVDILDSPDLFDCIDRYSQGAAHMLRRRLDAERLKQVLVTGTEVRWLLRHLTKGEDDQNLLPSLSAKAIAKLHRDLRKMEPAERLQWSGLPPRQTAALLPAVCLLHHWCIEGKVDKIIIPILHLRDGLLADCRQQILGRHQLTADDLLTTARRLAKRYGMNIAYARNTAHLSRQIFEQTASVHQLDQRACTLLEFAAWVHDVGSWINIRERHKHTYYILTSATIAGLSPREQQIVAHTARYHRGNAPLPTHTDYQDLPRVDRVLIASLAGILRIAYSLDVERSQRVTDITCRIDNDTLHIVLNQSVIALEAWAVAGKSELFRDVFGLGVIILPKGQ